MRGSSFTLPPSTELEFPLPSTKASSSVPYGFWGWVGVPMGLLCDPARVAPPFQMTHQMHSSQCAF
eukprot:CAMPEP_0202864106 /NCGR_PEP_ID=MMETSP1391-20130828/4483_1 /ASSEMBLY_ACC=CAM_ASM_000867 /TAXON_ID=1034604 /ORGANISM="Chlamydomonas leiostraca, Strain SAG 11-49" /LENGTH=65 /DNA_ID=CAMNT_0049543817 /DNA_START=655 /DNA_END=852 /DNA_ORIENTATION=+